MTHDPRIDPKPGDVVDIRPGWRRWVTASSDRGVIFNSVNDGGSFEDCFVTLEQWRLALSLPTARVIHAAD